MSLCYVIDTSYLLELFKVDNKSELAAFPRVKQKFADAIKVKADFVVPVPVLFELANHIAQIGHAANRRTLSTRLSDAVIKSLEEDNPWHITPCENSTLFKNLTDALISSTTIFAAQFAAQQIGLTDTLVVSADRKLTHL